MTTLLRFGWPALIAGVLLSSAPVALGQTKSSFPEFTGKRVYVVGVPDRYQGLNAQISRLERASRQTYYVVVTRTMKPHASIGDYTDRLFDFWQSEAARTGRSLDPDRSIIIVAALDDHKVGVHIGAALRKQLGLHAETVEELINKAFIGLAKDGKYPEAIGSLLDASSNWIAAREKSAPTTSKAPSTVETAPRQAQATAAERRATSPNVASTPAAGTIHPEGQTPSRQPSFLWTPALTVLVVLFAGLLAILGWLWANHRKARLHLAGQIKEIKSKAVDVMDRLDSLKERLKLMPTST